MPGKNYEVYVQHARPWWKIVTGILFSHLGMFILCILYAVAGAQIFIYLERDKEVEQWDLKIEKSKDVDDAINYLKKIFWHYANNEERYNFTREEFRDNVKADLDTLKKFVIKYNAEYNYDGTEEWDDAWTFEKALLFTITIMSTIGYGHIAPKTAAGKLVCIIYALIGIPLLLVFMANIGDVMANAFRWLYSRFCCRWCRVRRRDSELPPTADRKSKSIINDEVGKETYMPTDIVNVPIMVNLMLIFFFLFGGAVIFSSWEEGWDIGSSVYFCFVTLTTIGFGDMVPGTSFTDKADPFMKGLKMSFTILYCIFGMTLVSMCINLMQEQILLKVQWFAEEVGMSGNNSNEEVVKVTKEDRIKQTPSDMTGNELDFNEKRKKGGQPYMDPEALSRPGSNFNSRPSTMGAGRPSSSRPATSSSRPATSKSRPVSSTSRPASSKSRPVTSKSTTNSRPASNMSNIE